MQSHPAQSRPVRWFLNSAYCLTSFQISGILTAIRGGARPLVRKCQKRRPGKGSTAPAPCREPSLHSTKRYAEPFSHYLIVARTSHDRTGGHRRIREEAGDTVPARAPAVCIPKPVITWIGAFSLKKSPKSPHVNVMAR